MTDRGGANNGQQFRARGMTVITATVIVVGSFAGMRCWAVRYDVATNLKVSVGNFTAASSETGARTCPFASVILSKGRQKKMFEFLKSSRCWYPFFRFS